MITVLYCVIKLFFVKCFRKFSYDVTISQLTEKEAILLFLCYENVKTKFLLGGTHHHFVKYRLCEEGNNEIITLVCEKILKFSQEK